MFGALMDLGGTLLNNFFAGERQEDSQAFADSQGAIQRSFNSAEALAQRNWEEYMSSTAVSRRKADLIASGFNPLLAIAAGGAAQVGGGATASAGIPSAGIASPGSSPSYAAAMASASQVQVNEAAADKLKAEADEVRARTPRHEWDIEEIKARIPMHQQQVENLKQQVAESAVRIEKIWADVSVSTATAENLKQQNINLKESVPLIRAQVQNLRALSAQAAATTDEIKQRIKANLPEIQRILGNLEKTAKEMDMPQRQNQEAAADSFIGQLGAYIRQINPLKGLLK